MGVLQFFELMVVRARFRAFASPWLGVTASIALSFFLGLGLLTDFAADSYLGLWAASLSILGAMLGALVLDTVFTHRVKTLLRQTGYSENSDTKPDVNPELLLSLEHQIGGLQRANQALSDLVSLEVSHVKALEQCAEGFSFSYLVTSDRQIEIKSVGDNLVRFINVQRSEFVNDWTSLLRFVDPSEQDSVRQVLSRSDAFPEREKLVFGLQKAAHEEKRYYQLSLLRHRDKPEYISVYALLLDVSDHVLARIKAESEDKAKSDFLATVSHELRTPLNAIVGFSRLLESNLSDVEMKSDAHNVVMAGESLHLILNDILDYSRIEAQGIRLENRPFDLNEVLSNIYQLNKSLADQKGIELTYINLLEDNPALLGDPHRLRQVFQNLVSNALKFTEQGFVRIKVSGSRPMNSRMEVFIEIIDSGIGISQVALSKLFRRFTQAGRDTHRKFGGTGLGLAISKGLVELMGGRIDVTSEPGVGSVFTVYLNMAVTTQINIPAKAKPEVNLRPLDVLIVDDHPLNLKLLDKFLVKRGHKVVKANGGLEAVQTSEGHAFDLILMDIDMPEVDGHEASRRIRAGTGKSCQSYICALSGLADEANIALSISCGMNKHLTKPVSFDALDIVLADIANGQTKAQAIGNSNPSSHPVA
ncbi:MAG: ATP-binding protein [Limnobacter sp.]|nr:ATP-binding protein [Limnobacter sp.]